MKSFNSSVETCWEAFQNNWLTPDVQDHVTIKLPDGSFKDCHVKNLHDNVKDCPDGFIGKADDEFCIKVHTEPMTNFKSAIKCYEDGSDLFLPSDSDSDEYAIDVLKRSTYSQSVNPGYYHIGLYQHQILLFLPLSRRLITRARSLDESVLQLNLAAPCKR